MAKTRKKNRAPAKHEAAVRAPTKGKNAKLAHPDDDVGLDENEADFSKPGAPKNVRQIPAPRGGGFDSPFIPDKAGKTGVVRAPVPTRTAASRLAGQARGQGGRFLLLEGDFEDTEGNVWTYQKGTNTILELDFDAVKTFPNKFKRIGADNLEVLDESEQPELPLGPVPPRAPTTVETDRDEDADEEEDED